MRRRGPIAVPTGRRLVVAALVALAAATLATRPTAAAAKDMPTYPEGVSTQTLDDHSYELIVPKADDAKPPYSLLLVLPDGGTVVEQFLPLAKDGWLVLLPKQKFRGGRWATSETKDIHDDVDAVAAAFSVPKDRVHLLAVHDYRGFASFVAFDKRRSFASVSHSTTDWSGVGGGKSPPTEARRRLGVFLMGEGSDPAYGDPVKIAADLADRVRTVEYRRDESPFKPYYRYWLAVMDGRFRPGHDLSFDWVADAEATPSKPSARVLPPPKPALDVAKSKASAAFVYFWSADDLARPEAKALQNDVFLDADVRAAGGRLVAVKLDRAKYETAFTAFGLKTTPAVAVVDAAFEVLDRFEGAVDPKALAKSLVRAAKAK